MRSHPSACVDTGEVVVTGVVPLGACELVEATDVDGTVEVTAAVVAGEPRLPSSPQAAAPRMVNSSAARDITLGWTQLRGIRFPSRLTA
jgi:hypothetical protein